MQSRKLRKCRKNEVLIISLPSDQDHEHLGEFISSVYSLHQGRLFSESSFPKAARSIIFKLFLMPGSGSICGFLHGQLQLE